MDFLQVHRNDAGVNLRRGEARMTQQLLDVADVRAAFEHFRRARMAQPMRGRVRR